jgi:hypothetical protein
MEVRTYEDLTDQTAFVTGASRGIGAEIASQLADLGTTVYGGARTPSEIDAPIRAIQLDVTDPESVESAVTNLPTEELDILVNNAAVPGPAGPIDDGTVDEINKTVRTNLLGPIYVLKFALPMLRQATGARVVNISSTGGRFAGDADPGRGVYSLSKAGLNGLTVQADAAYADDGLLVNSASPGWVSTDLGGDRAPRTPAEGAETPVWLARFKPGSPSGKFWHDKEIIEW